jgi:hypothetical protein
MFDIFPEFLNFSIVFPCLQQENPDKWSFFSVVHFSFEINKLHLIVRINLIADQVQGQFNAVQISTA